MMKTYLQFVAAGVAFALIGSGCLAIHSHLKFEKMHKMPDGMYSFRLTDPPPACARWKDSMPRERDPHLYASYIAARNLWRSKRPWTFSREENLFILETVKKASDGGDWGARALLAHFYLHGLGSLPSNRVLEKDAVQSLELVRAAVEAGQSWGYYDMGVAYQYGYGGLPYDGNLAWAYYLKAAQLGSPEAQLALAAAYARNRQFDAEEQMHVCAFEQGHGRAAYELALTASTRGRLVDEVKFLQEGVKFGSQRCAAALQLLFARGYRVDSDAQEIEDFHAIGVVEDQERRKRYEEIAELLDVNPDLRLPLLDKILPLPPTPLPDWEGVDGARAPPSAAQPTY